jgi:hypothetical protein
VLGLQQRPGTDDAVTVGRLVARATATGLVHYRRLGPGSSVLAYRLRGVSPLRSRRRRMTGGLVSRLRPLRDRIDAAVADR